MGGSTNRPFGVWFPGIFVVVGTVAVLVAIALAVGGALAAGALVFVVGLVFAAVGGIFLVGTLRSHRQAVATATTVAALSAAGWQDVTERTRREPTTLPGPVLAQLRLAPGGDRGIRSDPTVVRLAGIDPSGIQAAAVHTGEQPEPIGVAEGWLVTSTHQVNGRTTGGTIEPRVVAWQRLPSPIGAVTIRPDNVRMRLADLTGIRTDHTVGWEAVDETWHLYGDDEPLLRAVVDIGLMGRLAELPGRWIVQFVDGHLLVVPTADRDELTARPPTLADVAGDIAGVVVAIRSILPEMLWSDLDAFLAAYRR